ncbi:MAG: hypothetical protein BWY67_01473 [Bacteroidetes bacterium ADurb.Bin397]|nr:MAG: hypothetical protein BWY67_01473 [Bacteroidetes bacterium ADurb.Bin397]
MKTGERVGAIESADEKVVRFYGYGVYAGEEVPPKEVSEFNFELGLKNPKIELDNGKVVWGCQCWWGPEEKSNK